MLKFIPVDGKLVYYCSECGSKLEKMEHDVVYLGVVNHAILRCPFCATLSSVPVKDCLNECPKNE